MNTETEVAVVVAGPEDLDWADRFRVVDELVPEENRQLVLDYLDWLAEGKRTNAFLIEHDLTWPELNRWIGKRKLYPYSQIALKAGNKRRLRMAEDELMRRAVEGVDRPLYHRGALVDNIKEYSDQLLMLMLRAEDPDKYADRQRVEHQGVMLNLNVEGVR